MKLVPIISKDAGSNVFFLQGEGEGAKSLMIDASMDPEGLNPDMLLLTHCHFDHIAMAKDIQRRTGCEILMSGIDADFFEADPQGNSVADILGAKAEDHLFKVDRRLKDGDIIDLGELKLEVIETPGHSPGGISLYEPQNKLLFSGDMIFAGSYGRYDLPGGNKEKLKKSIARLGKLDVNEAFPGHGPSMSSGVKEYINSIKVD